MEATSSIAIVIVNYRTPELALRCVASLEGEKERLGALEVIVVDGGSGDHSAELLREGLSAPRYSGWVSLLPLDFNGGFGWANNQAMLRLVQRDEPPAFIHLLNPDTIVEPGAVSRLREALVANPRAAAAGSQLVDEDGSLAGSAFRFPTIAREFVRGTGTFAVGRLLKVKPVLIQSNSERAVDWVTGASVMLRVEALRETGLFDDGFFLYFEEVELMHRLRRAGWEIRHVPGSRVLHIEGAATGLTTPGSAEPRRRPSYWYRSRRRYFDLTGGALAAHIADLAWFAGRLIWRVRKAIRPGAAKEMPHEEGDLLAYGLRGPRADRAPAAVSCDVTPGRPPAWADRRTA